MKKKTNVKKYSRNLKIKKIKCSRKILRGGSNRRPSSHKNSRKSIRKISNMKNYNRESSKGNWKNSKLKKYIETYLMKLYECENIEYIEKTINNNFNKYKCYYPKNNTMYRKDSLLFVKNNIENNENVYNISNKSIEVEVYKVFEMSNNSIGIEYNKHKEFKKLGKIYKINLITLCVSVLQSAINTNNTQISSDNRYLEFKRSFPSLIIREEEYSSFKYTSREFAKWINVYEDNSFSKDNKFIQESKKPNLSLSNLELYIKIYQEINTIIKQIPIEKDEQEKKLLQDKQKLREGELLYKAKIFLEYYKIESIINENIGYILKIALWLKAYLDKKDELLNLDEYKCDLTDLNKKYIIIEKVTITKNEEYIICGYPDEDMRDIILNLVQIYPNFNDFNEDDQLKLFVDLYNSFTDENDKINGTINSNNEELYKYYSKGRKGVYSYITNYYDKLYKDKKINDEIYSKFIKNFNENIKIYFNLIAKKYLSKPVSFINYTFLIYKIHNDMLIPAFFNIKELEIKHKIIFITIDRIIKHNLPKLFNILKDTELKHKSGFNGDDEYKLFYSYSMYGKCFCIKTNFLHTMSNLSYNASHYKNNITLDEIIYFYSNKNMDDYCKNIKINYYIRDYRLNINNFDKFNNLTDVSRSKIIYDLYNKKLLDETKTLVKINNDEKTHKFELNLAKINIINSKIILIYKLSDSTIIIFLKQNDDIYRLEIKPNLSQLINYIIKKIIEKNDGIKLNNSYNTNNANNTDNNTDNNEYIKFYKIIKYSKINKEDYSKIFKYNPLVYKFIRHPPLTNTIDTSYYYDTNMLDITKIPNYIHVDMPNLYTETKPYLYLSYLNNQKYKEYYDNYYINNKKNNLCNINVEYEIEFVGCFKKLCNETETKINCILFDINGCGYDFIEIIDNSEKKIVVYVYPHKYKDNETYKTRKYIGNFLDLDKTSLDMLKEIKKMYSSINYLCFLHSTLTPTFYTLHFHITSDDNYKRQYPTVEMGSFMLQDIFIDDVINNLKVYENYYKDLNYNLIKLF